MRWWATAAVLTLRGRADSISPPNFSPYPLQPMVEGADISVHLFDKTDSMIISKVYHVEVDQKCPSDLSKECGITETTQPTFTNDPTLVKCLDSLLPECKVTITGSWNWTQPDPPRVCAVAYLGFKLPKVGGVVPLDACDYLEVTWWDVTLGREMKADELLKYVSKEKCWTKYEKELPEACAPRIQWGNDIPGWGCAPPDMLKSSAVTAGAITLRKNQFEWTQPHQTTDINWDQIIADHVTLTVALDKLRTDRKLEGFIMSLGGTDPMLTAGNFYGMEVPFKCDTFGRKGTVTLGDDDQNGNFYQTARKYTFGK